MDRLKSIVLVAGLGCFVLAFLLCGLYPYLITDARRAEASIADVAEPVSPDFKALKVAYPLAFAAAFRDAPQARLDAEVADDETARAQSDAAWRRAFAEALRRGRDVYVREGCWHCHSQYVRAVANEPRRFGPRRTAAQDHNALQRPVLWGTRRVGPDLTNEGGLRSNDWHVAHLADPRSTSPGSVMPRFPWLLREGWALARVIDPAVAEREGLPPERSYRYPGVHAAAEGAAAALVRMRDELPPALEAEKARLRVERARGPNADGLAIIAYLQWLGTWSPRRPGENQ